MVKDGLILVLMLTILVGCNYPNDNARRKDIETDITEKFNALINAATNLDIDLIFSFYDKEVSAIEQGYMYSNSEEFLSTYRTAIKSVSEVHQIDIINPRISILNEQVVIYEAKLRQDVTLKSRERIEAINV